LPVCKRVIDHGREEVDRVDDREVVAQTIDSGVVAGGDTDEQIGMAPEVKPRQNRAQVRRTQLAGSTRRLTSLGEADNLSARRVIVLLRHRCLRQSTALSRCLSTGKSLRRSDAPHILVLPVASGQNGLHGKARALQ
jgi:hypothetical protein